jgi:hypothetical protein
MSKTKTNEAVKSVSGSSHQTIDQKLEGTNWPEFQYEMRQCLRFADSLVAKETPRVSSWRASLAQAEIDGDTELVDIYREKIMNEEIEDNSNLPGETLEAELKGIQTDMKLGFINLNISNLVAEGIKKVVNVQITQVMNRQTQMMWSGFSDSEKTAYIQREADRIAGGDIDLVTVNAKTGKVQKTTAKQLLVLQAEKAKK